MTPARVKVCDDGRRPSDEVQYDLLVVGTGAGGLSAAVTVAWHGLRVIVAEKESVCGGATAWSGGWMWGPLNPLSQADGIIEDLDQPRTYLKNVLGDKYDEARVDALLRAGPHMVGFFENHGRPGPPGVPARHPFSQSVLPLTPDSAR